MCTRIYREDIGNAFLDDKLDIDQAYRLDQAGDEPGRLDHALRFLRAQCDRRIDRERVPRMDSGALNMLQDARDKHGFAIAYGIDVELSAQQVLVDKDRAANAERQGGVDVTAKVISRVHDLHASTAEHVRRPNQHGVADPARDRQAAVDGGGRTAGRLWDPVVTE